jgi:Family of unknown function (DUF6152)
LLVRSRVGPASVALPNNNAGQRIRWNRAIVLNCGGYDMKAKTKIFFTMVLGLLVVSVPLFAHHGGVAYDTSRKITLKGTIVNFEWTNPHSQVHLDVKDDQGNVVHWDFENQPPSILVHAGWNKNSLKPGDQVTIIASPAKNGSPVGLLSKVLFADGQELTPNEK